MSEIDLCELPRGTKEKRREIIIMYENGDSEYKISRKTKKPVTKIRIIIYKYKKMKALIQRKKVVQRSLNESDLQMVKEVSPDMINSIYKIIFDELNQQMREKYTKMKIIKNEIMRNDGEVTEENFMKLVKYEKREQNIYKYFKIL